MHCIYTPIVHHVYILVKNKTIMVWTRLQQLRIHYKFTDCLLFPWIKSIKHNHHHREHHHLFERNTCFPSFVLFHSQGHQHQIIAWWLVALLSLNAYVYSSPYKHSAHTNAWYTFNRDIKIIWYKGFSSDS